MSGKRWLQEHEPQWQRLESLLGRFQTNAAALPPQEIRELGLLYRSLINDLSRAQSQPDARHLEPYLNNLAQRCHAQVYERPPTSWGNVSDFFLVDFPRAFRKNVWFIALAFFMFALGSAIAMAVVHLHHETEHFFLSPAVIEQLDRGVLWTDQSQANPSQSSFLMTNNIRVAINAFATGVMLGVGSLFLLFHNGLFAFGGPLQVCIEHGMGPRLINFMIAHGVIELTTIFIAGGAGMIIGFAILFPGDLPRWQAVREKSKEALILIMGCFPLLVLAGLIEGLISLNRAVNHETRLTVAILSAIFLVGYLGFSGRKVH
jgi:uncharacterized membrane protein SpoIIM required for sporulation